MTRANAGHGMVIVGGQWGDEGKGRIVDSLAKDCAITVRFHGGNNAGHSLHFDNQSVVLHLIPCGIVRQEKVSVIGNGVVIDPEVLLEEIATLKKLGVMCTPENLKISRHAHIILPLHRMIDQLRESNQKSSLGTTKRGIGPCYEDKVARIGIRVSDLLRPQIIKNKLELLGERHHINDPKLLSESYDHAQCFADHLAPFMDDTGAYVDHALKNGAKVLFEGAQGALLDVDHGTYPFVTSSNCVAAQAAIGTGIGPGWLKEVVMVTKAYCTRVGEGPFLTELEGEAQEIFRKAGNEFGATTGRPRRCGWLDIAALKYAAQINGATSIVITKFDILVGLGPIKVATGYKDRYGSQLSFVEAMERVGVGEEVRPSYEEFAPIEKIPAHITCFEDLPQSFRRMCALIEKEVGVSIGMISYGKERGQEIKLHNF